MTLLLELLARLVAPLEPVLGSLAGQGVLPLAVVVGLVGAAAALTIVAVARIVLALGGGDATGSARVLREGADLRLLVFTRDPDARGHVRARAPGQGPTAV